MIEKCSDLRGSLGKASDKVAALEKAGVTVTNSPAKIGITMLNVRGESPIIDL